MPLIPLKRCKDTIFSKKIKKKFGGKEILPTFAIPNDKKAV